MVLDGLRARERERQSPRRRRGCRSRPPRSTPSSQPITRVAVSRGASTGAPVVSSTRRRSIWKNRSWRGDPARRPGDEHLRLEPPASHPPGLGPRARREHAERPAKPVLRRRRAIGIQRVALHQDGVGDRASDTRASSVSSSAFDVGEERRRSRVRGVAAREALPARAQPADELVRRADRDQVSSDRSLCAALAAHEQRLDVGLELASRAAWHARPRPTPRRRAERRRSPAGPG